jgi:hypothetical protein
VTVIDEHQVHGRLVRTDVEVGEIDAMLNDSVPVFGPRLELASDHVWPEPKRRHVLIGRVNGVHGRAVWGGISEENGPVTSGRAELEDGAGRFEADYCI